MAIQMTIEVVQINPYAYCRITNAPIAPIYKSFSPLVLLIEQIIEAGNNTFCITLEMMSG